MKKSFLFTVLSVLSLMILFHCSDENINSSPAPDGSSKKNVNQSSLNARNDFNFTNAGELSLSNSQIISLYSLCSTETDFTDIHKVLLYTSGNENGEQDVDINNLKGISFYKYKNGFLEHSFYKNNNGAFQKIEDLTLKSSKRIASQYVDFVIQFSSLPTTQLSVYWSDNPADSKLQYEESMDFEDFMILDFGSHVKLQNSLAGVGSRRPIQGRCGTCKEDTNGYCDLDVDGEGNWCEPKIFCPWKTIQSNLANDVTYANLFDINKTYEIRDQLLSQSMFGHKYKLYYYFTSFSELNFSLNESIQLATLLPEIYAAYDRFKNNETNEIVITEEFASDLIEAINEIKQNNSDKTQFLRILDDVKDDINFVKNKNVGEIKNKIF